MTALAERAVACAGFRWMRGMSSLAGWLVYDATRAQIDVINVETGDIDYWSPTEDLDDPDALALPDLDDPATLGCLLALVREAWPECDVNVHHCYGVSEDSAVIVIEASNLSDRDDDWSVWDATGYDDCLVQALESAPQPGPVTP